MGLYFSIVSIAGQMINTEGELDFRSIFAIIMYKANSKQGRAMEKRQRGFTMIELMIVICIMAILFALMMPNFMRARASGLLTSCEGNLKNMATSIEQYSSDNAGRYPVAASDLVTNYIKELPLCPSAKLGYTYTYRTVPDAFTVFCKTAKAHGVVEVPDGFPQYDSANGLLIR
jgi:prepilin-type N-terminal cleavage/methylation domain-containing protein